MRHPAPSTPRSFPSWLGPRSLAAAASRRLCRPGSWSNLGGDRTWLSPEVEFFYPQHPDTTVYLQPREFDPGDYRADVRDPDVIRLTNAAVVAAHRTGRRIPLRITKAVRLAANPQGGSCPRGVAYAGYSLEVTLEVSAKAVATTGRMAYLHRAGRSATVVIRSFQPDPSGIYADCPVGRPAATGFAVQACNIDSHWGSFSEMEHHAPAIGGDTRQRQHRDVSQVWGFSGPRDAIDDIMESLCGARGRDERN